MNFLWLYPLIAFFLVLLAHFFLWLRLPYSYGGNEHLPEVSDKVEREVRWIPFFIGAFLVFMSFRLVLHVTPLWFDLSVPLAYAYVAKTIGVRLAKRRLRKAWLRDALNDWREGTGTTITIYCAGGERKLSLRRKVLGFPLGMHVSELTEQVKAELELIYKRVRSEGDGVYVVLGEDPVTLDDLIASCKKLPGLRAMELFYKKNMFTLEY